MENKYGLIILEEAVFMRVTGQMIKWMEKEYLLGLMDHNKLVSGRMESLNFNDCLTLLFL